MRAYRKNCPVCVQAHIDQPFLQMADVPVHCNLLWPTREGAVSAPRGDIYLGCCPHCGHVFNMTFDPSLMEYTQEYENSLHFSPRFQQYATRLAQGLIDRYALHGKNVVEIGAGKGDFLKMLWEMGKNRGIGFDPSYVPQVDDDPEGPVQFVLDFYSEKYTSYAADLICCRHVLEHIEEPDDFVAMVQRAVNGRTATIVFFEVPNVLFTLQQLGIWDIIYEHCSYFSPASLAAVFRQNGFRVLRVDEVFGGQFLTIEAQLGAGTEADTAVQPQPDADIAQFSSSFRQKVQEWQTFLQQARQQGKRVVVWGSGSKGVTFMNLLQTEDAIQYVVDINPRKQGKYVAGTGQEIVPPHFLQTYRPDIVIIMNANYEQEIAQHLHNLGVTAELLHA